MGNDWSCKLSTPKGKINKFHKGKKNCWKFASAKMGVTPIAFLLCPPILATYYQKRENNRFRQNKKKNWKFLPSLTI